MQTEISFHPLRIYLLIRNTLFLNRSSILVISAALAAVLILLSFFDAYGNDSRQFHRNLYLVLFFPGGILLTSRLFKGLHDPIKGYSWLLLPSSVLEKTVSVILLSTGVYAAGSVLYYLLVSLISEGINMLFFNRCHPWFNPFDPVVFKGILTYITIQAPFLTGAAYFKKRALSKTILSLFCFLFILVSGVLIAAWIILGEQLPGLDFQAVFYRYVNHHITAMGLLWVITAAKAMFWIVLPMISWTICYFRLRETEL